VQLRQKRNGAIVVLLRRRVVPPKFAKENRVGNHTGLGTHRRERVRQCTIGTVLFHYSMRAHTGREALDFRLLENLAFDKDFSRRRNYRF
jgi:hypothetical protein